MTDNPRKPLGHRAYGHIGHLLGSRLGPGDHKLPEGQARICTEKKRAHWDYVIVTEKLDGSNCSVALLDGQIIALGRAGYLAETSRYEQHAMFADWVRQNEERFRAVLCDGERVCGEWLAQAHSTLYELPHEPYVIFDIMHDGHKRMLWDNMLHRLGPGEFTTPHRIFAGGAALPGAPQSIAAVEAYLDRRGSQHGGKGPVEGAVWRVESQRANNPKRFVDFLGKWVRPEKQDGIYLPEISEKPAVWNWRPEDALQSAEAAG